MASTAAIDQNTLLEATWAAFHAQVVTGNQQLVLPDNLPRSIVSTIGRRYGALNNSPVSSIPVPYLHIIRLMPFAGTTSPTMSPSITSLSSDSGPPEPKGKAKVPRPPNAFILYRQHHHPIIKKDFPGIVNNDICKYLTQQFRIL
jgi:hypothetical protein